jgi:hypothetical protein
MHPDSTWMPAELMHASRLYMDAGRTDACSLSATIPDKHPTNCTVSAPPGSVSWQRPKNPPVGPERHPNMLERYLKGSAAPSPGGCCCLRPQAGAARSRRGGTWGPGWTLGPRQCTPATKPSHCQRSVPWRDTGAALSTVAKASAGTAASTGAARTQCRGSTQYCGSGHDGSSICLGRPVLGCRANHMSVRCWVRCWKCREQ